MTQYDAAHLETPEFSRPVKVAELHTGDNDFDIQAKPAERDALAERLGVDGVDTMEARASLCLLPTGDVRLDMTAHAVIRQTCVVTLGPMKSNIKSVFTTTYTNSVDEDWGHDEEEFADLDTDIEPPEPIESGQIDLGEACVEQLALEIDPFPRVKGAKFDGYSTGPVTPDDVEADKPNPFAALAKLKTQQEKPD